MSKHGPIVLVEDDDDDKDLFKDVLKDLSMTNKLLWFENAEAAFGYLENTTDSVFVIFSDINLPGRSGLEFKKQIDDTPQLRKKSIPFIFLSTAARQGEINEAYTQMTVQGFFKKANDYAVMKVQLKLILEYWSQCLHPNTQ